MREGNTYLNKITLAQLGLLHIDPDQLLALDMFNSALYELLYVGVVTGLEAYLKERLRIESMSSLDNMRIYAKKYNNLKKYQKLYKNKPNEYYIDAYDGEQQLKKKIEESLNRHIYHHIDTMFEYFRVLSGFEDSHCSNVGEMKQIINNRNRIVHGDNIIEEGTLKIGLEQVIDACDLTKNFIEKMEGEFQSKGREWLIDLHPEE